MRAPRRRRRKPKPQSNQRGIETQEGLQDGDRPGQGLNRTSVGLKPDRVSLRLRRFALPQSNQRGIETPLPEAPFRSIAEASIEPAWD